MSHFGYTVSEAVRRGRLEEPVGGDPSDLLRGLGLLRDGVLLRAAAVLFASTERLEFLDNRQFNGNAFTLLAAKQRRT